ncbi:MAG: S8 family serine peptidase [Gammaproteobacteria bacterium]|nr:S8 family serine peptidase [Gammaproteobacteria bacterium]
MSASFATGMARGITASAFTLDEEYEPINLVASAQGMAESSSETYLIRGTVKKEEDMEALRALPEVAEVWHDTPIAPFVEWDDPEPQPEENPAAAPCPIPPCDCDPRTPKGTMADVASYLGVDQVWAAGFRGTGMVVGVLDSGITAQGRPVKTGETPRRIPRIIGGWPSDWGTESGKWGNHGNMCATDVLGMAPDAQLYDLRIAGTGGSPGTISRALQAFNWAITRHRTDGTPHVLSNSWGIFQESWDTRYARNPNHPFTRKVVEAINEGILVLFAAGNCGDTCADGRCGTDIGPGRSIWGANGHPQVMTVGAVNKNEQFIGYSSRGPAALDPNKPDFCSISHFTGYNTSDSGTSAATPICAGVVALLKQAKSNLSQSACKSALKATAKDIGPTGFDQHSGAGIIQPLAAYRRLRPPVVGTLTPPCRPTVGGPRCPRVTLIPRDPRCTRPTTDPRDPRCFRPTANPRDPRCVRSTANPRDPRCIRPTLSGPRCPRPTSACPRPTLSGCPRPTLACPRPTLSNCPRPTLACPRPTFSVGMCTPPRPFDVNYADYGEFDYDDYGEFDYDAYGEFDYDAYGEFGYDDYGEFDYDDGYCDDLEYWSDEEYPDPYLVGEEWYGEETDEGGYDDWDIDEEGYWPEEDS